MTQTAPQFLTVGEGSESRDIAYLRQDGTGNGLFWLSGFKSDMRGSKAEALAGWAESEGHPFTRLDYSGHGASGGAFEDGTISRWLQEAKAVFDREAPGNRVIVGSSMGGWLALLLTLAHVAEVGIRASRIQGLVLIAPAADFTEALMWNGRFDDTIRKEILETGRYERPSAYGDGPYVITKALIEDGRKHLLLDRSLQLGCPVTILQGRLDPDVPWQHAQRLVDCLPHDNVTLTLVPDGDHRLSRPQDLEFLIQNASAALAARP